MDQLLDYKTFHIISRHLTLQDYRNLRILCVFGRVSVIYVTNEDKVYGFGNNRNGCLALGADCQHISRPTLNLHLSDKCLIDIQYGYFFGIGLTADGRCYSWGLNNFGQLGVGNADKHLVPQLIGGDLTDKRVIRMCVSDSTTLALTECQRMYGWGRNMFGQLGDWTVDQKFQPVLIEFGHKIAVISCGKTHAMALTDTGRVYTWGNNRNGQLGREMETNDKNCLMYTITCPKLLDFIPVVSKVVCGSEHSLLLTTDGEVYAFGLNSCGQIGNGSKDTQFLPTIVSDQIRFKDIIAKSLSHISIGVAVDDEYYIWGQCDRKPILKPQKVCKNGIKSVFELFVKFSYKITQIVCPSNQLTSTSNECSDDVTTDSDTQSPQEVNKYDKSMVFKTTNLVIPNIRNNRTCVTTSSLDLPLNHSSVSIDSTQSSLFNSKFQQNLCKSFNNPKDSDIVFRFRDQLIYGHKIILKIRNEKFWEKCEPNTDADGKEIRVKQYSYKSFLAFIQYLYTNSVEIGADFVDQLLTLANIYGEESLASLCSQFMIQTIDVFNVCQLYAKALELKCEELETKCHHFMAQNIKDICLTQEFLEFDSDLAKQFIIQAFITHSNSIDFPGNK